MTTLSQVPRFVAPDLTDTLSQAGLTLTMLPDAPGEQLRAAITQHGGYRDWTVGHTGWVGTLHLPEEQTFSGGTLEDGLAACLAWLVAPERRAPVL